MIFIGNGQPGRTLRGPLQSEGDFSLEVAPRERVVDPGGEAMPVTEADAEFIETAGATVDAEADVLVSELTPGGFGGASPSFESLDPAVATVDAQGRLTRVSDGTAMIRVRSRYWRRKIPVTVARSTPAPARTFTGFVPGSLAQHLADAIDSRLAGKSPATSIRIHDGTAYDAGCWCGDVDFTCMSREIPRSTLVSPRHVLMANHFQSGGTITFLAADGTIVSRAITARQRVGTTDIVVGMLASDVPAGIAFAELLPRNWLEYVGNVAGADRVPCILLDQDEHATVREIYLSGGSVAPVVPAGEGRAAFSENITAGDSGSPVFVIKNGRVRIANMLFAGGLGTIATYAATFDAINAVMTTLGGGYQLTEADPSGFPSYA